MDNWKTRIGFPRQQFAEASSHWGEVFLVYFQFRLPPDFSPDPGSWLHSIFRLDHPPFNKEHLMTPLGVAINNKPVGKKLSQNARDYRVDPDREEVAKITGVHYLIGDVDACNKFVGFARTMGKLLAESPDSVRRHLPEEISAKRSERDVTLNLWSNIRREWSMNSAAVWLSTIHHLAHYEADSLLGSECRGWIRDPVKQQVHSVPIRDDKFRNWMNYFAPKNSKLAAENQSPPESYCSQLNGNAFAASVIAIDALNRPRAIISVATSGVAKHKPGKHATQDQIAAAKSLVREWNERDLPESEKEFCRRKSIHLKDLKKAKALERKYREKGAQIKAHR